MLKSNAEMFSFLKYEIKIIEIKCAIILFID